MQDNEIRYQMALLDGYPASCKINIESLPVYGADGDVYDASSLIPDYLKDLNAVAKVVLKMSQDDASEYRYYLKTVVARNKNEPSFYADAIDATARQRCEAILRAAGKWEA